MINGRSVLALIPARAGSKRLPGKNLKDFCGKPLIAWTIEQAKASKYIDQILVSSDSREILHIAKQYGVNESLRPDNLATDTATLNDLVLREFDGTFVMQYICLLQPTSPLRTTADIDCGIELDYSISVGPTGAPNGAVYVVPRNFFLRHPYFGGRSFYMPAQRSVDIDTQEDWDRALMEARCVSV